MILGIQLENKSLQTHVLPPEKKHTPLFIIII